MTAKDIYDQLIKGSSQREQQLGKMAILVLCAISHVSAEKAKKNPNSTEGVTYDEVYEACKQVKLDDLIAPKMEDKEDMRSDIIQAAAILGVMGQLGCDNPDDGLFPTYPGMVRACEIFIEQRPMKVSAVYEVAKALGVAEKKAIINN